MPLIDLPQEILGNILLHLEPVDINRFGRVNHAAQSIVSPSNQTLWRSTYLHLFDDPQDARTLVVPVGKASDRADWDWHAETRRRLLALAWLRPDAPPETSLREHLQHLETVLNMVDTAKIGPTAAEVSAGIRPRIDDRSSLNIQHLGLLNQYRPRNRVEFLIHHARTDERGSISLWGSAGRPTTRSMSITQTGRPELASRLHVMYGTTAKERHEPKSLAAAKRIVYDWNRATEDTDYGPFHDSGNVNWLQLEAVHSVIARNFELCADGYISMPQGFCFAIPYRTLADPTAPDDWARVSGPWLGTYSFLAYEDLFAFNTAQGARPNLEDEPEACGDLMQVDLKLNPELKDDRRLKMVLPISHDLPALYFSGHSKSTSSYGARAAIGVRGFAALCPGGREVRWRFIIS